MLKREFEQWKTEVKYLSEKAGDFHACVNMYKLLIIQVRMDAMETKYKKLHARREEYEFRRQLDLTDANLMHSNQ